MHGLADPSEEHVEFLVDNGFGAVVADGSSATVSACAKWDIPLYLCSGAYGKGPFPDDLLSVDVNGDRQIWFGSTCPNQPEVRTVNLEGIAGMAATDGIAGIYIDGCRFASPSSGLEAFFACFCDVCAEKADQLGYDFTRMKADSTALYRMINESPPHGQWTPTDFSPSMMLHFLITHPGILDWFRFREACTTDHLRDMRRTIKDINHDLVFAIYIFTPTLATLVGQNYAVLQDGIVDLFSPMIYRNFPPPDGPACLNREIYDMAGWFHGDEEVIMQVLAAFFGVPPSPRHQLEDYGLPPQTIGDETRRARLLIGEETPLIPILYLDDPEIEMSMRAAFDGGADGVSFFVYHEDWQALITRAGQSHARG
jgi:hypothetical protein